MKFRPIHPTIILIIVLVIFHWSSTHIKAQELNLSLYPPLLRVNIKPGKSITQVFKIDNASTENIILVARIVPFSKSDANGNPILDPASKPPWLNYFSLANSEITLDQPFEIKANSSEQLILSLSVPDTAPQRDIYLALLVSTYGNDINNSLQGTSIRASIASNVIITINTQLSPATILTITDFSLKSGSYLKLGSVYIVDNITPVSFNIITKNEGDFTTETKGIFKLQRGERNPINLQSILPQFVIAKNERQLVNSDDTHFDFSPEANLIGLYQARVEIHADNTNSTGQINILFFPAKILFGFTVGLSLLLIIINTAFKRQKEE